MIPRWIVAVLVGFAVAGGSVAEEVQTVGLSLAASGFEVRGLSSGLGSPTVTLPLAAERPEGLKKEPPVEGEVLYGELALGGEPPRSFALRVDLRAGRPDRLYFDADGDRELGDDPGPLYNTGSGLFACLVRIPFERLEPRAAFLGSYVFWVFVSEESWQARSLRAYSHSQLHGTVRVGDSELEAWVVERLPYDGDLTNDGLCLDLDFDGQAKSQGECLAPGEVLEIRHGHLLETEGGLVTEEKVHRYRILLDW